MPVPRNAVLHCRRGSTITTPRDRTPVWHNARQQSDSNPGCLVRPKGPLLRPALRPMTTTGPDRGKDRRRRPAKAGAKRHCGGPVRWSHSLKEGPYAPRSEERSWKRQLGWLERPGLASFVIRDRTIRPLRQAGGVPTGRRSKSPSSHVFSGIKCAGAPTSAILLPGIVANQAKHYISCILAKLQHHADPAERASPSV